MRRGLPACRRAHRNKQRIYVSAPVIGSWLYSQRRAIDPPNHVRHQDFVANTLKRRSRKQLAVTASASSYSYKKAYRGIGRSISESISNIFAIASALYSLQHARQRRANARRINAAPPAFHDQLNRRAASRILRTQKRAVL
jgi:hypothetical protein